MNPETALQVARSFDDFDEITAPSFAEFDASLASGIIDDSEDLRYLDTLSRNGGGWIADLEAMKDKWWKSANCKLTANEFEGYTTQKKYYRFFPCLKWWCPDCGAPKGAINKKRIARILDRIGQDINQTVLRQLVFTVPEERENDFQSKAALNSLIRMAEKITKKLFPGLKCIASLHLFGDRGRFRFRPHVHILVFDLKGCRLMLPQETLDLMRERWRLALQAYMRRPVKVVDVQCSFVTEPKKINHRIRYVSRPCPGPGHYEGMKKDLPLLSFCMNTLQGFIFARYFNGCRSKKIKDDTVTDQIKETVSLAGERLIFVPNGQMSRTEFNLRYQSWDYDELSPGFFRIHGP